MLLSNVIVLAPGGIGTLLEFFYSWQLMQVKHTCKIPIILMGDMWRGLLQWIRENPLQLKFLNPEDMDMLICVNSWQKSVEMIEHAHQLFKKAGKNACINLKMYAEKAHIDEIL